MACTRIIEYCRPNLKVKRIAYPVVEGETVSDMLRRFMAEKKRIFHALVLGPQARIAPSPNDFAIVEYVSDAAISHFGRSDKRNMRILVG